MRRPLSVLGVAASLIGGAAWFVLTRLDRQPMLAHDVYAYFYPNVLYALARLREGGEGLLWNPYQSCGSPFFGSSQTGLLYPTNVLFLLLAPAQALRASLFVNLLVGGVFAYLLGRELGVGRVAALAGALAFELGNATLRLAAWAPMAVAPWVWVPAAMLYCERLLRAPSVRGGIALGVVVTIALLAGTPQPVMFAYQLIALRILWELVTVRVERRVAVVGTIALGLALPTLLAAVQLFPAVEVARLSARSGALTSAEIAPYGDVAWTAFRTAFGMRSAIHTPFVLLPCLVAAASFASPRHLRVALFYLFAGALYFILAFGGNTPLFQVYLALPLGRTFRQPIRFMWVPSFCLAVLTALGADALTAGESRSRGRRLLAVLAPCVALLGFWLLKPASLRPAEHLIAALAIPGIALAAAVPALRAVLGVGLLLALALNVGGAPSTTYLGLLLDDSSLYRHEPLLARLRDRMTPQERVHVIQDDPLKTQFALTRKTASLLRLPSIFDFDPQPARRYSELFVRLRNGRPMNNVNDVYYSPDTLLKNQRLLDLTAARWIVANVKTDTGKLAAPLRQVDADADVAVYEYADTLPRARWVPAVEVVRDDASLLERLATADDLARLALLDGEPPSGFHGDPGDARTGLVEFVENRPEHVVLRVEAPARGFVVLADEWFPGWVASVDGEPSAILRANYAFRAVEVPAGTSRVAFRYAPASVKVGALVSAATLLAVIGVLCWPRIRARARAR